MPGHELASCATATASSTPTRTYARGAESIGGSYNFLDLTALGRQEDWEEPPGRAGDAPKAGEPGAGRTAPG